MGPIEVLYCWQSLLCALAASGLTQLVKTIIDVWWGHASEVPTPTLKDKQEVGKFLRQRTLILNRIVLPTMPILFGVLYACIVPARPDALVAYIAAHSLGLSAYWIFAAWGGACGQFADYVMAKAKDVLGGLINRSTSGLQSVTVQRTSVVAVAAVATPAQPPPLPATPPAVEPTEDEGGS